MFRAIFEFTITAFIVLGTLATAWFIYSTVTGAVSDPYLRYGVLWQTLFGR